MENFTLFCQVAYIADGLKCQSNATQYSRVTLIRAGVMFFSAAEDYMRLERYRITFEICNILKSFRSNVSELLYYFNLINIYILCIICTLLAKTMQILPVIAGFIARPATVMFFYTPGHVHRNLHAPPSLPASAHL